MKPTPWPRAIAVALAGGAVLVVVVLAFLWPSVTSTVHGVPVAVVGDAPAATAVTTQLSEQFDVREVASREEAVELIRSRDVYGALVPGGAPEVLTASANGPVVSQMFGAVASNLGAAPTDIVAFAPDDARGSGISALSLPLVIGGIIGGVVISTQVMGVWRRLLATAVYGLGAGIVVTLVGQNWFGILQGSWATNVLAVAMSVLAVSALIVGLTSLIGPAGIAVGAIIAMFVGNPISGVAQPTQFLPGPWGEVGQFLPPGASSTLLRNLSYFPDASSAQAWWVLTAWTVAGVALMTVGHRTKSRGGHTAPAPAHAAAERVAL